MSQSIEKMTEEIKALAPWHQNIQLLEDFSTGKAFSSTGGLTRQQNQNVALLADLDEHFIETMSLLYPKGLTGKRVLDCACNAGIYCFAARQLGAEFSFGFDVRQHWIDQANWVIKNRRVAPTDRIRFAVCDLYELPKRKLPQFDVTMFKGIFYHLPDPIMGLRIASDLTRDILIFNSQTTWGEPDGYLRPGTEDIGSLMSGAYGLNWRPTGPKTMIPVLNWLGYKEARVAFFRVNPHNAQIGRLEIIASKIPGRLSGFSRYPEILGASD